MEQGQAQPLSAREQRAAAEVVRRVRSRVAADLVQVFLFGSQARGEARPDSDVDLLLIFRALPPDREPYATQAEQIADQVAAETGIPVATWSVSLPDLDQGWRTPMLVDALDDGILLWPSGAPPLRIRFTPADALRCAEALFQRVREGSDEVTEHLHTGDESAAARRARDDIIRLCTAALLLEGETRPRRGQAARRFTARYSRGSGLPAPLPAVLEWAATSFGPDEQDEDRPVTIPAGGLGPVFAAVGMMRDRIGARAHELAVTLGRHGT